MAVYISKSLITPDYGCNENICNSPALCSWDTKKYFVPHFYIFSCLLSNYFTNMSSPMLLYSTVIPDSSCILNPVSCYSKVTGQNFLTKILKPFCLSVLVQDSRVSVHVSGDQTEWELEIRWPGNMFILLIRPYHTMPYFSIQYCIRIRRRGEI